MNTQYDLEDLAVLLACACDNLILIHTGIENGGMSERTILNVVFSAYTNLCWITAGIQEQVDKIPHEIILEAKGAV